MYSLLTEFRDGDNVVTTLMEHNSNFVPWYALCHEILPRFGRRVECRRGPLRPRDRRAGPRPPRRAGRRAHQARLRHRGVELPGDQAAAGPRSARSRTPAATASPRGDAGRCCSSTPPSSRRAAIIDVRPLDVDYLAFSFHKVLAPFGVGVLYAREPLLERLAAVPLRRRHDRRGRGDRRSTWTTTSCPGSTPPARPTSSA